jgi:hypothetical protein
MDRLIALLSVPPPGLRNFIVSPAVLVFSYYVLTWIEPSVSALGLSPFVLAFVFAMGAVAAWTIPVRMAQSEVGGGTYLIVVMLLAAILALLLYVHDPLICQRFLTVILALRIVFLVHALWRAPEDIPRMGGPTEGSASFADIWGRWKIVSFLALIFVNEAAIRHGSLEDWIIAWSIAPVVIYCLTYWTMVAEWWGSPDADED